MMSAAPGWIQVLAGELVRERGVVPHVRELGAWEVREHGRRRRRAEHARGERHELRLDADVVRRLQHRFPDVGGELEDIETLLPERHAGIAADRRRRRRIVEADARCVVVDDDDLALGERRRDAADRHGRRGGHAK